MNKQMTITMDGTRNRFLIRCPMWANDVIRDMPNRRWSKAEKAWAAPVIRRNVEFVDVKLRQYADISPEAEAAIVRSLAAQEVDPGATFPAWYKFKTEPRSYQIKALNKLYPRNAGALHADMGTGKSKMSVDLASARRIEGKIQALLIICKLTLRENWLEQLDLHCPIPYSAHLPDTAKVRKFDHWMSEKPDFPILLVGTESLSAGRMRDIAKRFCLSFTSIMSLIDESSMIANHQATRSEECVSIGRMTEYRLTMSGTPIVNGPMNLFMQFEYLDPDIIGIGDFFSFRNRYAVMGGFRNEKGRPMQIVGYQNLDELVECIAPYVYEITKEEALPDLPPKRYQKRLLEMSEEQRHLYQQIKREGEYVFNDKQVVTKNVLELMLRLHQICGGHVAARSGEYDEIVTHEKVMPDDKNPKLVELRSIVEDANQPMLVWCAYKPEIAAVVKLLESMGKKVGQLHGDIKDAQREENRKLFQSGQLDVIVGNAATGGMGYTLTAATLVVYYSNTNKLIDRLQSEDRAHRMGQLKNVMYIDLIINKSVDVAFLNSLKDKKDLADFVRGRIRNKQDLLEPSGRADA